MSQIRCVFGGFGFRLHVVFVLCGSSTHCPWEYPVEGMLSQSWQPWCWGHYSVWKVRVLFYVFGALELQEGQYCDILALENNVDIAHFIR